MKEKLNEILSLIIDGLGEWAAVDYTYCPAWALPFKRTAEKVEETFTDFDKVKDDVRKEIEGRFIDSSIKHAGRISAECIPFEVGRRKRRGVEYQVFVTVCPVIEHEMPQIACPKCGKLYDDFDGLAFSHCPACGYCSHPAIDKQGDKSICGVCGREVKRIPIGNGIYNIIEV
jgi:hypothetical protein